jgi:hypothetical protein
MNNFSPRSRRPLTLPRAILLPFFAMALALATSGCQSNSHTSNPRLRKIDEMLAAQLPNGTTRTRVQFFVHSRGFIEEYPADRKTVVAVVRLVDTDTLQPATARVTFHFDPQDKLTTYDMEAAPDTSTQ